MLIRDMLAGFVIGAFVGGAAVALNVLPITKSWPSPPDLGRKSGVFCMNRETFVQIYEADIDTVRIDKALDQYGETVPCRTSR